MRFWFYFSIGTSLQKNFSIIDIDYFYYEHFIKQIITRSNNTPANV